MARVQQETYRHADTVRKCVSLGFWLVAAGAAATLGLDLDGEPGF
jgi:hypothetical protein